MSGKKNTDAERQGARPRRVPLTSQPPLTDTGTRPSGLVNLKARMEVGGLAGVCQEETAGTSQPASQAAKRQTKAEITQRRQRFLLPLPPRFLWCNSTPGESPGEQTHRTSSRPVLHRRLPLPLLSAFSLLAVFLVSFNS